MEKRSLAATKRRLALTLLAVLTILAETVIYCPEQVAEESHLQPLETRLPIVLSHVQGRRTGAGDLALHPGESVRVRAVVPGNAKDTDWRLRLIGEVDVDGRLLVSASGHFPSFYRLIDDALDSHTAHHRTWSLRFRSNGEEYPRRSYWRVFWDPAAPARESLLKIWIKKEGLELLPGGRVGFEVAVYEKHPGRNPGDITGPPDAAFFLDAGSGTEDWQERRLAVSLRRGASCILFTAVGERFRGKVWFEDPHFPGPDGVESLPPFAPSRSYSPFRNWFGENLSEKEWPRFRLTLNGKEFFCGKLYHPSFSWPALEVDVPPGLVQPGENELTIQYISDYHEALAYIMRGLEWLKTRASSLEVLACPTLVEAGKEFVVLIKTREAGLRAHASVEAPAGQGQSNISPAQSELDFPKAGLQFVKFRAASAGPGGILSFRFGAEERQAYVERVAERPEDGVLVGSADSSYITADQVNLRRFHVWYLHNSIGNCIIYRPLYFWGGTLVNDPEVWKDAVRLAEAAGLKYSVIVDGRDMPDDDPTDEMLSGPLFRGPQMHEQDTTYNFWGSGWRPPDEELFWALWERLPARRRGGCIADPSLYGGRAMQPLFFDRHRAQNMREAAEYFVEIIQRQLSIARRHAGPTTLFKYFFQAGYNWLAAETMYGPNEILMGALRGASLANGQARYGAHVAAAWGATPLDDPWAFRRYFLGLATPYIHGAEQIYMEDGLWHMENGYTADDRFSPACQGHLKVHRDFYHFTRAHSRRGHMRVPVAFLQGQYDGWSCFSRSLVWGKSGAEWDFAEPEKSWDLLKVFFPRSEVGSIYRMPCPHEPVGWFTGTPYGPADIVPVEASQKALEKYPRLVFLGWNTADTQQVERLRRYVQGGGHLILGLPHLSTEVRRNQSPRPLADPQVRELLGMEIRGLKSSTGRYAARQVADHALVNLLGGRTTQLGDAILQGAVSRIADSAGMPVVVERNLGSGRVTFVNVAAYPGDADAEGLYRTLLREAGRQTLSQEGAKVWVKGTDDASFAVYDWDRVAGQPATHTVYLLNVNWWSDVPQATEARLLWKHVEVPLEITRDKIHVVTVSGDWGIWTQDNDTDVMSLSTTPRAVEVALQGEGATSLRVLYRPAAQGAETRLCGQVSQAPLALRALQVPGVWQTELTLHGPARLQLSVCP